MVALFCAPVKVCIFFAGGFGRKARGVFLETLYKSNKACYNVIWIYGTPERVSTQNKGERRKDCNCTESKVIDSRSADDDRTIRRRRECMGCGRRFTTYETIEVQPILVVKNDGTRQAFDVSKIKRGIDRRPRRRHHEEAL